VNRWERFGLLAVLVEKMDERNFTLGKTALQKLIYLLKMLFDSGVDYDYELYIYGPYSRELASDFEYLVAVDVIDSKFKNNDDYGGYKIRPGRKVKAAVEKAEGFIKANSENLDRVIDKFGKMTARELELKATILYLNREEGLKACEIGKRVKEIKPYFNLLEIEEGIKYMEDYLN
jgi:uncharacterized protein